MVKDLHARGEAYSLSYGERDIGTHPRRSNEDDSDEVILKLIQLQAVISDNMTQDPTDGQLSHPHLTWSFKGSGCFSGAS